MAPQTHTRYRVQRLIRLGEWLERNQDALVLAFDVMDEAHDTLVDMPEGMTADDAIEFVGFKQMQALASMRRMVDELRHHVPGNDAARGGDVTIYQPYALKDKYEVVIPAPKPEIETQQRFTEEEQKQWLENYNENLKDKAS